MSDNNGNSEHDVRREVPRHVLDQAVAWGVKLYSGTARPEDLAACSAWRDANPLHEYAWRQLLAMEQEFSRIPENTAGIACRTLEGASQSRKWSRRQAMKLLGYVFAAAGTAFLVQEAPWRQRHFYAGFPGERRSVRLNDDTRLLLNSDAEVEVVFSPLRRLVVLRWGEVLIETGRDAYSFAGRRSFHVETAQARLEAIGTEFIVRQLEGETRLHVTGGAVAIHLPGVHPVVAHAGDSFAIRGSAGTLKKVEDETFDATAWMSGTLVAKRMRLDAFAAELSRYHRAPIVCTPDAASLKVSGVFQLSGTAPAEQALKVLETTLPVRIVHAENNTIILQRQ